MRNFALILKFLGSTIMSTSVVGWIAGQFGWVATLEGEALPLIKDLVDVAVLFSTGAFFYGIGYVIGKRAGTEVILPSPVLDPENLGFVYDVMRKNRNGIIGFMIFFSMCAVGILAGLLLTSDPANNMGTIAGLGALFLLCFGLAFLCYYRYSQVRDIKTSAVYRTIIYHPGTITDMVVTTLQHEHAPGKLGRRFTVGLMQGKKGVVKLMISERDLELLRQHIVAANPAVKITTTHQSVG